MDHAGLLADVAPACQWHARLPSAFLAFCTELPGFAVICTGSTARARCVGAGDVRQANALHVAHVLVVRGVLALGWWREPAPRCEGTTEISSNNISNNATLFLSSMKRSLGN